MGVTENYATELTIPEIHNIPAMQNIRDFAPCTIALLIPYTMYLRWNHWLHSEYCRLSKQLFWI